MTKIIVFLMMIQGMPLWELSQSYQWSPQKYVDLFTRVVTILSPAEAHAAAPVADAGSDKSFSKNQPVGSSIALDGSGSYDPDGDSLTYQWYGPFATTSGLSISKSISEGTYTVSLVVDDGMSRSDIDTAEITIEPCFNISARAKSGKVQLTWTHLDGTERYDIYRANESNPSTFTPIGSTTSTYSTHLDDTVSNEITYLYVVGALSQGEWCYSNVISSHPTVLRTRVPVNYAPVIYSSSIAHGTTGIIYNYDVNATDPNGDALSYSLSVSSVDMDIDPVSGLVTWIPHSSGSYGVAVNVTDGNGKTDTQTFTIVVKDITSPNRAPVANAGPAQAVFVGDTVTLDGSGSTDVDGDPLTFTWSFTSIPSGSAAALSDPAVVNPTFVVDMPGTYTVQLIVNDGLVDSDPDTVTITTENSSPVANAGPDQTVFLTETVQLDGSTSSDVDGDLLTFNWSFTSIPDGSIATLSDPAAMNPTFVVDEPGIYVAQLIVNDGTVDSDPDTVSISTENSSPVADAGPDQTVFVTETVQIDGSGSSDVDGDFLSYEWSLTSIPSGSAATLSDPTIVNPTFVADLPGTYTAQLIVNDGTVDSNPDAVVISTQNSRPVANAGSDQTVSVDDTVALDGSASSDVDGDPLTYQWSFTSIPSGSGATLSDPAAIDPTFEADLPGMYVAQLIVNDGELDSAPDSVVITTENRKPVADAGGDQTVNQGDTAQLNGGASSDPDGDPLIYSWALTSVPSGSTAVLSNPAIVNPTFVADIAGTYVVQLIVNDGMVESDPDIVTITATEQMITVPDFVGMEQTAAEAAIIAASLIVGNITTANSATVPAGHVITQDPVAGVSVVEGSGVDLVISMGPVMVTVPDVVGQPQADAETAITNAGLAVGNITETNSDTVPAGHVISQDPTGNSSVTPGTVVDLVVSSGPAAVTDHIRPEVTVTVAPTEANVGDSVTISVSAVDNVDVVSQELLVNGVSVSLDPSGTATYSSSVPGVFTAVATALDAAGNEGLDSEEFRFLTPGDTTPPTVALSSPVDEAKLSVPTNIIGTASDDTNLTRYKLEYSVKDKNEFVTFASGTSPVTNDVLGQLDPTMMRNGLYDIKLTAEDASGNTTSITRTYQLEGEMKVGNFTISFNDLTIPMEGIPITITRTYDSRMKSKGDFGIGWTMDLKAIEVQENRVPGDGWEVYCTRSLFGTCIEWGVRPTNTHSVLVTFPDGRDHEFDVQAVTTYAAPSGSAQGHLTFAAQPGTFSTLEALDNTIYEFLMGGELLDMGFNIINPNRYRLTDVDGTVYICNQSTGLEQITDPNGNIITFASNGIIHSAGKSVTFTRDTHGRITTVIDPMGNTIEFEYDFYGDLISVTDQEGNTTEFTYNSSHGLVDIIDPRGIRPARNEYDNEGRLVAIIDADGNRVEFTHNVGSRQEVVTDRLGNVTVYEYDDDGNVLTQTDALGNTTTYTYDANGNKLSETDALGNTTTYTYDAQDNLLTKTDPLGNTTSYTYNAHGQMLTTTDPLGNVTTNTYDANGNLLTTDDALGNTTTNNTYDGVGNLLSTTDPLGNVTSYTYDSYGNILSQTDPFGNTTTYTFDANGNQLTQTVTRTTGSGPETLTTTNVYDGLNRVIETIDALGNSTTTEYNPIGKQSATKDKNSNLTTYEYHSTGNLFRTTNPDGTTETTTYDVNGNLTTFTDRAERMTAYTYDALNRLIRTTCSDGSNISTGYDSVGRELSTTDARGNTTTYSYDSAGKKISITDPIGNVSTFTYDSNGNQVTSTDANGHTITYEYDANNRRTRTLFNDGTFATTAYDSLGRKTSETNQAGSTTQFDYDALGRLIGVTDALGNETLYTYDEVGNKLTQTDANGNVSTWEYDNLGYPVKHTLPLGMFETFIYDSVGNLVSKTDFNGETTLFTYEVNNRLIIKTLPDSSSVSYSYTSTGQRSTVDDFSGTTTYIYDGLYRLTEVVRPDGTSISYTYDAVGNRTSVTIPSGITTYTFDALNRLQTVTDPDGGVTSYSYDNVGNRAGVTYPNWSIISYTYDTLNRLTYLENARSDLTLISSYTYTLGPAGNRTQVVENTGRTVDYTYDALYRLVEEDITDAVLGNETMSYTYDSVGNRLSKTNSSGTINYSYDANDRLLTEGGKTYTYDNNGNTLSKTDGVDTTDYFYNYENRLISVQPPGSLIDYGYDADGIRVSSTVDGVMTDYLVDKNRDYAQVLEERDGVGALSVSYVYGDDLISQNRSSQISYYIYDGQGSTRQLTDSTEAITDTYVFDAFGIELNRTGTTENNYLYTGEQYDPNVGFYYLRARYYNPETGRFNALDTFGGSIYDPSSLHKYLYCINDPMNRIDPSGHWSTLGTLCAVAIVGILTSMTVYTAFTVFQAIFTGRPIEEVWDWSDFFLAGTAGGVSAVAIFLAPAGIGTAILINGTVSGIQYPAQQAFNGNEYDFVDHFANILGGSIAGGLGARFGGGAPSTLRAAGVGVVRGFLTSSTGQSITISISTGIKTIEQVSIEFMWQLEREIYRLYGQERYY